MASDYFKTVIRILFATDCLPPPGKKWNDNFDYPVLETPFVTDDIGNKMKAPTSSHLRKRSCHSKKFHANMTTISYVRPSIGF